MTTTVLARVPLTHDAVNGATSHAPMILGSVGGAEPARYILDTGSDVHILNEDLADELGLNKEPGEEGTDHSGATMPSWNVGSAALDLDGYSIELAKCVSIPALPKFREMGIRGILSPQNLHPTAWMVLDLASNELVLLEVTNEEAADFLRARSPALGLLTLTRDADFPSVVVSAALDGFTEMPTMLNTGGKGSEYSAAALPGLSSGEPGRLGGGVFGSDYSGGSVGRQKLLIGGSEVDIADVVLREQMHDPQGIVGMDVLRGTVLTVAADLSRPVFWQVPPRAS